eukprot:m.620985 g.620985  ORF g.620985 m.620985 type:complete len:106 (+) comp22538_c0_seq17:3969-4286(+)
MLHKKDCIDQVTAVNLCEECFNNFSSEEAEILCFFLHMDGWWSGTESSQILFTKTSADADENNCDRHHIFKWCPVQSTTCFSIFSLFLFLSLYLPRSQVIPQWLE